ncbi:MAG: endolytic transglycosylase MltG [Acidimicrobiales bacterium]|nr:endolytic transglycosylase MltG [Acidimicrobiales bacterium]MCB9395456.1 endolytic transglycosylase MltG [Acidimicrobiaceae bacterium]
MALDLDDPREKRPAIDWQHDPWDDPDATDAYVIERARSQRWPFKWVAYTLFAITVVVVLIAGSVGWWYLQQINPSGDPEAAVTFTVDEGETVESLSVRLQNEGFITNARVFRWYVERQGGLELTPGYYRLRPRDHMGNLLAALGTPPEQTYTSVTFPEGFTVDKMAQRLSERMPRLAIGDFLAAAGDGSIRSEWLPPGQTSLEGLLFPDTYQVSNGETPAQVVQRMVSLMERVGRQEDIVVKGYEQALTAYEVLIVASMVEREAKVDEDRALIARVILNRRRIGMPLQIDATLYYRQDEDTPFDQLKALDTPYNTYLHVGLPPTPIANPGRASIQAVLNPAPNPPENGPECQQLPEAERKDNCLWLYYVLADEDGGHAFAVTLAEHEANVQAALDAGLL